MRALPVFCAAGAASLTLACTADTDVSSWTLSFAQDDEALPVETWVPSGNTTLPPPPDNGPWEPDDQDHPDTMISAVTLAPGPSSRFSSGAIGDLLRAHLDVIAGAGPNAQAAYAASLANLKAQSAAVLAELQTSYNSLATEQYLARFNNIQIMSELRDPAAIGYLDSLARDPSGLDFPPAPPTPDEEDEYFPAESEHMIRYQAVVGICRIAYSTAYGLTTLRNLVEDATLRDPVRVTAFVCLKQMNEHAGLLVASEDQWILQLSVVDSVAEPPPDDQ